MARTSLAIQYVSQCDSTNTQLYRSSNQHHTLLVAETQTQGRGQFNRTWLSQHGDLIFSLGLRLPLEHIPALSIRVGLALAQVLTQHGCHIKLKWPNDLIGVTSTRQGKLAGILIQTNPTEHGKYRWVVIGIGLNIASRSHVDNQTAPSAFEPIGLSDLSPAWKPDCIETGAREALLMTLVDRILQALESIQPLPDSELARQWNPFDVWQGQTVQYLESGTTDTTAQEQLRGLALGINDFGQYCIQVAAKDGQSKIMQFDSGQIRADQDGCRTQIAQSTS